MANHPTNETMRDHVLLELASEVAEKRLTDSSQPPNVYESWEKVRSALTAAKTITEADLLRLGHNPETGCPQEVCNTHPDTPLLRPADHG